MLDDVSVEMDSNVVERAIRPIAFNRKNALFAGHDERGRTRAGIASLIETCKLNGVDLKEVVAEQTLELRLLKKSMIGDLATKNEILCI